MIPRKLLSTLLKLAGYYPVVVVTGPRQAGKTTLCRAAFPAKAYVSLESMDTRDYARNDPRGFLAEYHAGAIIDEIQNVPELAGYLQTEVDEKPTPGRFILTGSQHFGISQTVSQTLAGRSGMLVLLPPDWEELRLFPAVPEDLYSLLWQGSYPRIYDRNIPADLWLADYTMTYIQRDVRQVLNVGDLSSFSGFLKLCAGRTAQEINLSVLGGDAGVSHNTARTWLSVLEASYLVFRLPAWHANIRKQVVKAPKLHFLDSGLVCYLLNIREPEQLRHHPLRGAVFESWVVSEVYKTLVHRGEQPDLYHYRESRGVEVDLLVNRGDRLSAVEVKSGATVAGDFLQCFAPFAERISNTTLPKDIDNIVVYGGEASQQRSTARVIAWKDAGEILV
ncbi:MAG: ATP-binding protein [Proteobacteria bacterium]|nr:ATP-binding protein [Pseudomonadota bacterium]MBU1739681.1 ATP-binding protein [Pseudomonadota bacterium]